MGLMSVSDPRGREGYPASAEDPSRRMAELSNRLSQQRREGDPAPEELERLVAMIARNEIQSGDRLTNAKRATRSFGARRVRALCVSGARRRLPAGARRGWLQMAMGRVGVGAIEPARHRWQRGVRSKLPATPCSLL